MFFNTLWYMSGVKWGKLSQQQLFLQKCSWTKFFKTKFCKQLCQAGRSWTTAEVQLAIKEMKVGELKLRKKRPKCMWYCESRIPAENWHSNSVIAKKKWCNRCGKLVLELIAGLLQFSFDPSTIHYNSLDLRGQKIISYDDKWDFWNSTKGETYISTG